MNPEQRLLELGIELPPAPKAAGNYLSAVQSGKLLFVSGQLPIKDGKPIATGKLGVEVSIEQGQEAARTCLLNGLAAIKAVNGTLEGVRLIRLGGFVASSEGFTAQPQVINGASDLAVSILGENGKHARAAVGVAELPLGVPVEIELLAELP